MIILNRADHDLYRNEMGWGVRPRHRDLKAHLDLSTALPKPMRGTCP